MKSKMQHFFSLSNTILKMKRQVKSRKISFAWRLLIFSLAGIIVPVMFTKTISRYCNISEDHLWPFELALTAVNAANALLHFWRCYKYTTLLFNPVQKNVPRLCNTSKKLNPAAKKVTWRLQRHNVLDDSISWLPNTKPKLTFPVVRQFPIGATASFLKRRYFKKYRSSTGMLQYCGRQGSRNSFPLMLPYWCLPSSRYFLSEPDDYILDLNSLTVFLKKEEEKQQQAQLRSLQSGKSVGLSHSCLLNSTRILSKYQYQVACLPQREYGLESKEAVQEISAEAAMSRRFRDHMDSWTEKLRKWICETILMPLICELESVNIQMGEFGWPLRIGESSIASLRQAAFANTAITTVLNATLPYLEITLHQEYLLQRIKELSDCGYMSSYCWNGGGNFKGEKWNPYLPTDTAILMNVFSTYLDSRLPANPKYPDGKTFTSQYFVQTPNKPDISDEKVFCIHQTSIHPPHYKLIYQKQVFNIPEGRHNFFHTLLMFLYIIKKYKDGKLGRANFGSSGVNIICIFESY